jgi:hypothetical protein
MAENERSAPVIHSTTGTSWAGVTRVLGEGSVEGSGEWRGSE